MRIKHTSAIPDTITQTINATNSESKAQAIQASTDSAILNDSNFDVVNISPRTITNNNNIQNNSTIFVVTAKDSTNLSIQLCKRIASIQKDKIILSRHAVTLINICNDSLFEDSFLSDSKIFNKPLDNYSKTSASSILTNLNSYLKIVKKHFSDIKKPTATDIKNASSNIEVAKCLSAELFFGNRLEAKNKLLEDCRRTLEKQNMQLGEEGANIKNADFFYQRIISEMHNSTNPGSSCMQQLIQGLEKIQKYFSNINNNDINKLNVNIIEDISILAKNLLSDYSIIKEITMLLDLCKDNLTVQQNSKLLDIDIVTCSKYLSSYLIDMINNIKKGNFINKEENTHSYKDKVLY